ncbi:MAG: hypothetical protein GYA33_14915 [Thermogutta sp.]|nr:hypothetical protein [Thermogutta sp.]
MAGVEAQPPDARLPLPDKAAVAPGAWTPELSFQSPGLTKKLVNGKMDSDANAIRPNLSVQHWIHWCVNLLSAVGAGIFLIPYFRCQPESVHEFATALPDWQRQLFVFAICVILAYTLFKLFSPRLLHLRYFFTHPPTWSAWLLGGLVLCGLDLGIGLSKHTYTASWNEWLGYGLGSALVVSVVRHLIALSEPAGQPVTKATLSRECASSLDWTTVEPWLRSDAPASHDFLGNYSVAERMRGLLIDATRSIGIVGPFGAGKSSVVKWIEELVQEDGKFLLSEHSCWGFETSSASIHSMLRDAIGKVEQRIDTFQISWLPESYRQTFSAGGEWLDNISKMLFGQRDPIDQFRRLSALLGDMGVRLVFVVEDLDRNDSRSFDIQEVLAFLQQLKGFSNLSFILTGGLRTSPRIDYAKLCDHIEYLRTISVHQSGSLVAVLRQQCLNQEAFPHVHLNDSDDNQWNPERWSLLSDRDEVYPPEAIARLLNTPRALRHALSLTYRAWQKLYGEIDFDHLLAMNVLRYAAPEAFSFVLRHWHRFRDQPSKDLWQHSHLEKITASLRREWEQVCGGVDWDARAARTLIDLILPFTPMWFGETSPGGRPRSQGVQYERYWQRALNQNIAADEVRDQTVIRDMQQWIENRVPDAALVTGVCSNPCYSKVWEQLDYRGFSDDRERILAFCEQVLERIRQQDKAEASRNSQGFIPILRYAARRVGLVEANARWLEKQITEAASVSLELVNALWYYWGGSILRDQDRQAVRRHSLNELQRTLTGGNALISRLHPHLSTTLYHLVFDPGNDRGATLNDVSSWSWLGPMILEAVRSRNVQALVNCATLLGGRVSTEKGVTVDVEVLDAFFGNSAHEVIDILDEMLDQIPEQHQMLVRNIVGAARRHFAGTPSSVEEEADNDDPN